MLKIENIENNREHFLNLNKNENSERNGNHVRSVTTSFAIYCILG